LDISRINSLLNSSVSNAYQNSKSILTKSLLLFSSYIWLSFIQDYIFMPPRNL